MRWASQLKILGAQSPRAPAGYSLFVSSRREKGDNTEVCVTICARLVEVKPDPVEACNMCSMYLHRM
ncbi:predicted protein [Plenodomus lingam JN3]|uniref:Predicted protein n=1 Tax=Leptosphaeria maculans (strain JN3 / isolate v23.1.3 / race Av1-4-5-6-7-8) TaxID=985895 RepID=E4ZWQ1_LEPMJ|nr:predicted protein [Plenodomus lingam JN3]CBX96027.1 predicted protein [Plenodomus lingam JN3]